MLVLLVVRQMGHPFQLHDILFHIVTAESEIYRQSQLIRENLGVQLSLYIK